MADFGEVFYRPWFFLLSPCFLWGHLVASFEERFYFVVVHLPFCSVYDVPGSDAIDVVPDCVAAIGSSKSRDEAGEDRWVYRGSVFLSDALVVAEDVEHE